MANGIWLKLETQGACLRSFKGERQRSDCTRKDHATYTKEALQLDDSVLDRVLAAWGRWLKQAEALLRSALRRQLWSDIGRHLRTVKGRRDNRVVL